MAQAVLRFLLGNIYSMMTRYKLAKMQFLVTSIINHFCAIQSHCIMFVLMRALDAIEGSSFRNCQDSSKYFKTSTQLT